MTFKHKGSGTDIGRSYLPGMGADLSDLECLSGICVGTNVPFGLMLWYGPEANEAQTSGALNGTSLYRGKEITVMLPFKDGDAVVTRADGTPYALADFGGAPVLAGIGVYSSRYSQVIPLSGLGLGHDGDCSYGQKNCDSISFARQGRIFVYAETDLFIDSVVGYRKEITDPADEFQCRGSFGDVNDATKGADFTAAPVGVKLKVVKPSSAGGCAVLEIDL